MRFRVEVCLSGQHGALARDIAREVGLVADFDLGEGTDALAPEPFVPALSHGLARLLERLSALEDEEEEQPTV